MSIVDDLITNTAKYGLTTAKAIECLKYLRYFGYLQEGLTTVDEVRKAIVEFQSNYHLQSNGELDHKTIAAMSGYRCGVKDVQRLLSEQLKAKWNKNHLRYYIANRDSAELSTAEWDGAIATALNYWALVANLTFERIESKSRADLICDVGMGAKDNFDGPSGTLAWAYLPNGRDEQLVLKLDISETWIINPRDRGILIINVLCHEFGHNLGLDHSKIKAALMAPYYSAAIDRPQDNDDVIRIQALYGKPISTPTTPTTPSDDEIITIKIPKKHLEIPGYRLSKTVR